MKNRIISSIILLLLLVSTFSYVFSTYEPVTAQTNTSLLQYEWRNHAADPACSFYSSGPAPDVPNLLWKRTIPGLGSAITAFNGMTFVRDNKGVLYALDGFTGETVWNKTISGNLIKIDDTYMLAGTSCYKIADGTKVWTAPANFGSGAFFSGTTYIPERKLFVANGFLTNYPLSVWDFSDPSKPPTMIWESSWYYGVESITAYGEGILFVGTLDNFVLAYNVTTGALIWKQPTTSMSHYGMSYIDGKIVFGGLDNNMYGWDAKTGELLWTYNPQTWYGQWASASGAAYGMVYEHNQDTYVYAINASTGQMVWRAKGPGIGYSNMLSIADGKVYVQMGENQYRDFNTGEYAYSEFNCYDAYTGELLWSIPIENNSPSNYQAIAYGNLYLIPTTTVAIEGVWSSRQMLNEIWCLSDQGKEYSMFLGDPEHTSEGYGPTKLALDWTYKADASIVASPTMVNGVCYFGSLDGKIQAVNTITGNKLWSFETEYEVRSTVAVVGGKVYTGADDGNIYCLDAATGTKLWQVNAGGIKFNSITKAIVGANFYATIDPRSSPIVSKNTVYVGSLDGNLYSINANTGAIQWKFQTGGPILATPTLSDNSIYIPSCTPRPNGQLYKLDLNGNILWNLTVPYVLTRTFGAGFYLLATPTEAPDLGIVFLRNGLYMNYGINATTGQIIWNATGRFNAGTPSQSGGVVQKVAMLYKFGRVYYNDFYGVTALDAKTGKEIWHTYLSRENLAGGLSYSFGRIYTATATGVIFVLDAITGDKISDFDLGGSKMMSVPTPYNGSLFVTTNDWRLLRFKEAPPAAAPTSTPTPEPLTADAIAQKVLAALPAYPTVPSATEISQLIAGNLPSGVSADEVAQRVVTNLPSNPTAAQIAQEVANQLSANPAQKTEEPSLTSIVIIAGVVVAIAIGIVNLYLIRKRK